MVIRAIFLDFDGTISDSHSLAFKSMVRTLDDYGFKFNQNRLLKLMGSRTHIILKELGLNPGHLDSVRKKFYKYFIRGAKGGEIRLCVSVKPLWGLKKDYPLIVISNAEGSFIRASIKRLGLKGLFKKVYGEDKFSHKDELLKKLFKKMKIKPSEAIYVGDRFSDIEYARDVGWDNMSPYWQTTRRALNLGDSYTVHQLHTSGGYIDIGYTPCGANCANLVPMEALDVVDEPTECTFKKGDTLITLHNL